MSGPDAAIEHATKPDIAARILRRRIAMGELARGEKLSFEKLEHLLGMSVTPIREALRKLESEGLVSFDDHRGVRVADFSRQDAWDIYEIRARIEGLATHRAAERIGDDAMARLENLHDQLRSLTEEERYHEVSDVNAQWHFALYAESGSRHFLRVIEQNWYTFPWFTLWTISGRAERSVVEHSRVMSALRSSDSKAAEEAMRAHILSSRESVMQTLLEHGEIVINDG